tara:strand:- start:844 stop:1284 length:441 start_codon:yes stop_codon:yes gene_type:complete
MSTLVKTNRKNGFAPSPLLDDFFSRELFDWAGWSESSTNPSVNIVETNEAFKVEMAAPGMKKENFQLELDNDTLTIQAEVSSENKEESERFTRREFNYQSFKRSFYLPNTVEADQIHATYQEGILRLEIPKKEEAKRKPVKTIKIS